MTGHLVLVTGGARSGKSRFALGLASASAASVLVVATGVSTDDEMAARIERHRAERPSEWRTLEARYGLYGAVLRAWQGEACVLVDDLGSLVTNLLVEKSAGEDAVQVEVAELLKLPRRQSCTLIVVTAEAGSGLVPSTPLGRKFRDLLGLANQLVAAEADEAILMVAGLPLRLKG